MSLASSKRLLAAACAVIAIGPAGACSASSGVPSAAPDQATGRRLLERAPVAEELDFGQSPTAQEIRQRGELVIGSALENPLMSQQNPTTGTTEGFDATLGKLLAKYILGQPNVKVINTTAQIREALIQNNTVDAVVYAYTINAARAEKISFAGPYFISGPAIATLKTTTGISTPQDLNGKKVLGVANSTGAALIKELAPRAELITFGTTPECILALEQGRGDAFVNDLTLLAGNAVLNDKIKVTSATFGKDPYGIGIKHGDDSFKKFLNDWLRKIEVTGIWQQAYAESLGTVIPGGVPTPPEVGSVPGS